MTPHLRHGRTQLRAAGTALCLFLLLALPHSPMVPSADADSGAFGVSSASEDQPTPDRLRLVLDTSTFSLSVRDPSDRIIGPTIAVALGSPAMATPTGTFPLERVILSPSWRPGNVAKNAGAVPEPASLDTPMGAVKIPFAADGIIALHGGGDTRVLGKRVSAGCIRATDADLLRVVAWLDRHDALLPDVEVVGGELHRRFQRPVELIVR